MPQQNRNNQDKENIQDTTDPDTLPLCLKCLSPATPLQYYCDKCTGDDVINPLTPYIGFVNIRFNCGMYCTLWRRLWYDSNMKTWLKTFSLLLLIIIFPFPILLVSLFLIAFEKDDKYKLVGQTEKTLWWIALSLALLRMMFVVSCNLALFYL